MSLKAFHLVFMTAAVALSVWLGVWAWGEAAMTGDGSWRVLSIAAFAAAAGMVVYEAWFLRKTRKVSSW